MLAFGDVAAKSPHTYTRMKESPRVLNASTQTQPWSRRCVLCERWLCDFVCDKHVSTV